MNEFKLVKLFMFYVVIVMGVVIILSVMLWIGYVVMYCVNDFDL